MIDYIYIYIQFSQYIYKNRKTIHINQNPLKRPKRRYPNSRSVSATRTYSLPFYVSHTFCIQPSREKTLAELLLPGQPAWISSTSTILLKPTHPFRQQSCLEATISKDLNQTRVKLVHKGHHAQYQVSNVPWVTCEPSNCPPPPHAGTRSCWASWKPSDDDSAPSLLAPCVAAPLA